MFASIATYGIRQYQYGIGVPPLDGNITIYDAALGFADLEDYVVTEEIYTDVDGQVRTRDRYTVTCELEQLGFINGQKYFGRHRNSQQCSI